MDIKIEDYLDEQEIKEICKDALYQKIREDMRKLNVNDIIANISYAPVRHGRWIEQDKYTFGVFYDCSICGERILDNGHSWNYCPNCGAIMDGGAD